MGAAQSTRKITLVNDDKAGVIKLSESLAYRLRGQMEGQQAEAEAPSPAAAAEPLPTPPPVPVAPEFTPSEPSVPSTPIPQIPEIPKIPDIAPVPETAAPEPIASETVAPDIAPVPETSAPEPIVSETIAPEPLTSEPPVHEPAAPEPVVSEPSAPESLVLEPTVEGESHPLADVPVDTPSPILFDVSEPPPPVLPSVAEYADLEPSALQDNISEPHESTETESFEPQISLSLDESLTSSSEPQSPSTEIVEPPAIPSVEEESAEAEIAATAVVNQVQLPSCETLLAAAFPIDEAPAAAETKPDTSGPPVVEAIETLPSLELPLVIEEAVPTEIAKELLVAAPAQGEQEAVSTDTAGEPTVAPPSSPPAVEPAPTPDVGVAVKAGPAPTLSQPAGNIPPWSIYAEEAHLMVMRLREEKEQEMKKLNLNWRDKMDDREKEFTKMARLSEEEVNAALKDVEKLFMRASISPVCENQQEAVMTCYQSHPRQSLRCARDVEQFTQCVNLSRLQTVLKQRAN